MNYRRYLYNDFLRVCSISIAFTGELQVKLESVFNNNDMCICLMRPHLLDDLLQLPVLPLQLPGLFLVVVVGGRAGLQGVLLLRLPLAAGDETPHLDRRRDRNSIKEKIRTETGYPAPDE